MKKRFLIGCLGLMVILAFAGCGRKKQKEPELIRFVPVKYNPVEEVAFSGEVDECKFNTRINFKRDNKISVDLDMAIGDGRLTDHFAYQCTQEQIDKMQVSYQSVAMENGTLGDNEYRDGVYLGLTYALACLSQGDGGEANNILDQLYDNALGFWVPPMELNSTSEK